MNVQTIALAIITMPGMTVLYAADESVANPATNIPASTAAADTGTVVVTVDGLQSTQGLLYASLFMAADGFPDVLDQAFANQAVTATEARDGVIVLTFEGIPPGPYAIPIFHDANSDGKLNTNFLGIPSESYGFSQNPPSRFGPPSFEKAVAVLKAGETQQLVIMLK